MSTTEIEPIILPKKLIKQVGKAIYDFDMIQEGDHILLGLSGGKDSTTLAHVFKHLQKHAPIKFTFQAVTILYGMGEDFSEQKKHYDDYDIPHEFFETEAFELSKTKMKENSSFCSFFSRLRRGNLTQAANKFKCNKIALGHHLDDIVESLYMGMMYNGIMRSMAPKYTNEHDQVIIRPLCYVREPYIALHAKENNIPAVGDEMCPGMIMPGVKLPVSREYTKQLLLKLEKDVPHFFDSMRTALGNVQPETFFVPESQLSSHISQGKVHQRPHQNIRKNNNHHSNKSIYENLSTFFRPFFVSKRDNV